MSYPPGPPGTRIQTVLFSREKGWTPRKARGWLLSHKQKAPKTVVKPGYLHFRQEPPFRFKKGSFRTITLSKPKGIKAVIGRPYKKSKGNPETVSKIDNPKKGGAVKMAAKKKKKKKKGNPGGNPGKIVVYRKAKSTILGGINVSNVVKDIVPLWVGAMVCKFAAKRFVEGGEDQTRDWSWKNYALGVVGVVLASLLSAAVFKGKGRIAQNILAGGLLLILYKLFLNEIVPKSEWLTSWFAQDDDEAYPVFGQEEEIEEGDLYQDQDSVVAYGQDYRYRPLSEMHRQSPMIAPQAAQAQMGVLIEPRDPSFGVDFEPRDPTFGQTLEQRYKAAYTRF